MFPSKTLLPPNGLKRLLALATYGAGLIGLLGGAALSLDARYAKAADVQALRGELRCAARDIQLDQLRTRDLLLSREASALQSARQRHPLTPIELQRYNDLVTERGQLLSRRLKLDTMPGCP